MLDPMAQRDQETGEQRLWAAVLEDALRTYSSRRRWRRSKRDVRLRYEWRRAEAWIFSSSTHEGSFDWVCQTLRLSTSYVRRLLREKGTVRHFHIVRTEHSYVLCQTPRTGAASAHSLRRSEQWSPAGLREALYSSNPSMTAAALARVA